MGTEQSQVTVTVNGEPRTLRVDNRMSVLDLLRAGTRRFDVVFVLGLEEGSLPRRARSSPFLDDDERRVLDERGARLARPDPVARDRYLFYTACTRASQRLYLVREAADDDGSPREASPFWEEAQGAFDPQELPRWNPPRPPSGPPRTHDRAPPHRERQPALAGGCRKDMLSPHRLGRRPEGQELGQVERPRAPRREGR